MILKKSRGAIRINVGQYFSYTYLWPTQILQNKHYDVVYDLMFRLYGCGITLSLSALSPTYSL
mgnify:CR=1 FL=1